MRTLAGVDLGTQSLKIILYDWEAKKIAAQSQEPLELIAGDHGAREQKAEWYREALEKCFRSFGEDLLRTVAAVGVSGQQHGFVPLDADGRALYNVKLWNDTSTAEECAILTREAGGDEAVIREVCNLMLPGFTAPKILWLKRHKPEAFAKLRYIMLPHNYVNYLLTGAYTAEYGDASGTALFNGAGLSWSKKICDLIDPGLADLLPPLTASDEPAGFVTPEAARRFGLPEGIPVSSGGGDNMMAAIGTGAVRDGVLTMSLGTSGTLFGYSDKPIADPRRGLSGFNASSGGYLPLLCTMNCTVATEEVRELLDLDLRAFNDLAAAAPAGSQGVVFLPFFNGERTPNLPNGRAGINGLSAANCRRENIARAAMEAAIFGLRAGLEAFLDLGFKPREIRITGGGSKSPLWRQMAADIMNVPVKRPAGDEAAALGGALQALWCLEKLQGRQADMAALADRHVILDGGDCHQPDQETAKAYAAAYGEYRKYLDALAPVFT